MKRKPFFLIPLFAAAFVALAGLAVQYLWNCVTPELAEGVFKPIGYWTAVGLLVLCRLLFGGFGKGSGGPRAWKEHAMQKHAFMNMSDEDRARMREEWRRCGPPWMRRRGDAMPPPDNQA